MARRKKKPRRKAKAKVPARMPERELFSTDYVYTGRPD